MGHNTLSASAMATWMTCSAQVPFVQSLLKQGKIRADEDGSQAANLGTAAHELGEKCLRHGYEPEQFKHKKIPVKRSDGSVINRFIVNDKMINDVGIYVDFCRKIQKEAYDPKVFIESKFLLNHIYQESQYDAGGSSDFVMIDDFDMYVVDYKNGTKTVDAKDNPQALFYAVGAYETYKELCKYVRNIYIVIVQPNAQRKNKIDIHKISKRDLIHWRDNVLYWAIFRVNQANDLSPHRFKATNSTCFFCPAKDFCDEHTHTIINKGITAQDEFSKLA